MGRLKEERSIGVLAPLNPRDSAPAGSPNWGRFWFNFERGKTPTSTQLHPEYLALLQRTLTTTSSVLDVGSGNGRISRVIADVTNAHVVAIDLNRNELALGREKDHIERRGRSPIEYREMSGTNIQYQDGSFAASVLLGTLGAANKKDRERILDESVRVIQPGGTVYISEFTRIEGNPQRDAQYARDAAVTGDDGSMLVYNVPDNPSSGLKFIARHFTEAELKTMLEDRGIIDIVVRRELLMKPGWTYPREYICVWGKKA